MSTYYIENGSSGNQYYFDNNAATSSQTYRTHGSPVTFSTNFTTPPISSRQHDPYGYPQQHQSVAGFSKTTTHQYYATPSPPAPQVRARMRSVGQQDHPSSQAAPQQHHFQFDSRQQPGHPSGPAVVYQTPGAAQYTHRNVDLWTEGSSGGNRDHYVQAQRVSVRSVATGSPTRPQDSLQHYYSQLTPEQHQQLLQRQQQQQQQQQSPRGRVEEHPVQRQVIQQQRNPPQEAAPPASHPVGIRSLMSKFAGPVPKTLLHHPHRSQSTSSRHYSSSNYTSRTTTNTTNPSKPLPPMANLPTMTYSALPKPREPPVNSAEYYQMQVQQLGGQGIPNIQQAAAPAHIQHHSPLPQGGQERFRLGSLSDHLPTVHHQPAPAPPQSPTKSPGNTLSSLRDQYMHQTKETSHEEYSAQPMPPISRTIIGEDVAPTQKAPVSKIFQASQSNQNNNNNNQLEEAAAATNEATNVQTDA